MAPRMKCVMFAFVCAVVLLIWQALTVRYSYGGNWTGLFCTGSRLTQPAALESERIYLFRDSFGYDGQFYHYMAHDPFFTRSFAASIDAPRVRCRRILVSGLAFVLALGRDRAIDAAYILVAAAFIFLGSYWLSRLAVLRGYSPALGLAFAAVPAVLVSVDRLTVDVALAACCVGFALYIQEESPHKLYFVLLAAALTRETGLFLCGAYVIYLVGSRRLGSAMVMSTSVIPTLCWYFFVQRHTQPVNFGVTTWALFSGFVQRVFHPFPYPLPPAVAATARGLDLLALAGIGGSLLWCFRRASQRAWTPVMVCSYLFALLAITLEAGEPWVDVYAFGRTLSPLLVFAGLDGMMAASWMPLLAMFALDPRTVLQVAPQVLNIIRGITG